MKIILFAVVVILFAARAYAQPKELTCTEEAFNFNIGIGAKWKFSAPKMGPAEILRNEYDYVPAWSLKHNDANETSNLPPKFASPLNAVVSYHPLSRQNYTPLWYHSSTKLTDKSLYLIPGIDFNRIVNYNTLKPNLSAN